MLRWGNCCWGVGKRGGFVLGYLDVVAWKGRVAEVLDLMSLARPMAWEIDVGWWTTSSF